MYIINVILYAFIGILFTKIDLRMSVFMIPAILLFAITYWLSDYFIMSIKDYVEMSPFEVTLRKLGFANIVAFMGWSLLVYFFL